MAVDPGVPRGGKYLSRQELNALLGNALGDVNDLFIDRRKLYGKQAGRIYDDQLTQKDINDGYLGAGAYLPSDYEQTPNAGYYNYNPATQAEIDAAGGAKPAFVEWDVPTSTTDYSRPRTVAAGYDETRQTMTVVFRDGTFYNYYEVTPSEWLAFHASYSKGRPWLNPKSSTQSGDGLFLSKPRGEATDLEDMDPRIREALYRVARTQQQKNKLKVGRTSQTAPLFSPYTPGKQIGVMSGVKNNLKANQVHRPHAASKTRVVKPSSKGNKKAS